MRKSFIVIGLGRFGINVLKSLSELTSDILAIDVNEDAVRQASEYISQCAIVDGTQKAALEELDVKSIDHAIIAIGNNLQATILTLINLSEIGVKNITVRIDSNEYIDVMKRLGATEIIIPEEASAVGLANSIISDTILEYYKVNDEYSMLKILVGPNFNEKTLIELDSRNKFDINIIGITRNDSFFQPKGSDTIKPNDVLTVFGNANKVSKFDKYLNR